MKYTEAQMNLLDLCGGNTHTIWQAPPLQQQTREAFGFELRCHTFHNEPHEPKGAHLANADGHPIDAMEGVASENILDQIADHLGHKWLKAESFMGRGTRTRAKHQELLALQTE